MEINKKKADLLRGKGRPSALWWRRLYTPAYISRNTSGINSNTSSVRSLAPNGRPRAPALSALYLSYFLRLCFSVQIAVPLPPATVPAKPNESPPRRWPPYSAERQTRTDLLPSALKGASSRGHQWSSDAKRRFLRTQIVRACPQTFAN
ncbi:hypothetical protein EVAR_22849_1 [Eumeta japonica]|uniref:Uncharacterized protein n=1 Tax=Eumeta variegata TaxID=151549 RepID=A0A4C1VGF0_EUMVA|nr:hypothetical protein EVAR_22849_1 [Eumeta japonica]